MVILNFTPVPRTNYRIGVPQQGGYREIFNSDSMFYSGSNMGNGMGSIMTDELSWMGRPYSISLTVPPLSGIVLRHEAASFPVPEVVTTDLHTSPAD